MLRRTMYCLLMLGLLAAPVMVSAQAFEFFPGAKYDPAIPTLKQVAGHEWGERITFHHEIEKYVQALAKASLRVRLVKYGETWEGKALYYLIVTSEANQGRVNEVKAAMQRIADPRTLSEADAEKIIKNLPAVTWLTYGVHGNEISSPDAGLLTAYHLVASQNDAMVNEILEKTIVIIDPMENPDGRDRFIQHFRFSKGRWADGDPQAAEHNEGWPSGRSNHYMFDMNRDWFAMTQPETRGRVKAFLEWYPVVFVDLHEMGSNSTYYFAPPAAPLNPNVPASQAEWWKVYGKNNSEWFDKFRFDYFTREVYDSFYPGYGEGWPLFHGAIGMTYEQASVRGLVVDRSDDTVMRFRDSVQHHFISALSTAQTTARHREALLRHLYNYFRSGMDEGAKEAVKEYILPPGRDPNRTIKLAALLQAQGIEVKRADAAFSNPRVRDYAEGKTQARDFPAGTFLISLAQPNKRLAKTLLDKNTQLEEAFVQEQIRRRTKRLFEQFYDVTGWSLPLIYGVEAYLAEQASAGKFSTLKEAPAAQGKMQGERSTLVYMMAWGSNSAGRALAGLLRQGVRVHVTDKPLTLGGRKFPAGSLIVKVKDNPADLYERLTRLATDCGVDIYPSNSAWVEDGVNLGSFNVQYVKPPKIAMAWNTPTSSLSAGWARYVLEQMYDLPVTVIATQQLRGADLSKYNVLILPNGFGYADALGEGGARRVRDWVQAGGTLVSFANATRWLIDEKVGLLSTQRELRGGKPDKEEKPQEKKAEGAPPATDFNVEQFIQPERESPDATPGAILRVKLDGEHWLAFGYDGEAYAMVESDNIYTPLKLDKGWNVGLYLPSDKAMVSGFNWDATRKQLGNKAYLMYQAMGRGHVVAFAEDPNYRAFMDGLNLLVLNAVLFGPGH